MAWSFLSRSRGLSRAISSLGEEAAGTQLSQDQGRLSDCKGWTVHGLYSDMNEGPYLGSSGSEWPHLALVLWRIVWVHLESPWPAPRQQGLLFLSPIELKQ